MNAVNAVQIRKLIKSEIDRIQDDYLDLLFRIVKTFEIYANETPSYPQDKEEQEWHDFLEKFSGCFSDAPIERGEQGKFEIREEFI